MQEAIREAFSLCSDHFLQEANHESNSMDTSVTAFLLAIGLGTGTVLLLRHVNAAVAQDSTSGRLTKRPYPNFELDVVVNGRPLAEYYARGRTYVEALQGAEYELRVTELLS